MESQEKYVLIRFTRKSGKIDTTLEAEDEKTVTFTVTEVLKPGIHNHVVYLTDDQGLSEPLLIEVEVIAECPYEEPETGKFPYNMSLCGQVKIGDVFDTDPEDKVIALYNNECVGMANVDFDRITNKSSVHLTVFGDDKMNRKQIHFRLWQASTGKMYNLSADRNILFAHGFVYGCDGNRVVFTAGGSETQNISLHSGWNWISTNLDLSATKGDLNTCVTAAKPWSDADLIKNPNSRQFSSYDAASDAFVGSLAGLHFSQMYMMYAAQENTLQIAGEKLSADSLSIRVRGDGQWSPMPCLFDEPVSVTKALTSYYDYASQGDMIKAHNRFAYFSEDKKWEGDLTSLRPGEGYLFRRLGLGSKEIKFYRQSASNAPRKANAHVDADIVFSNPNAATNMTMIAEVDGLPVTGDGLRVFVGDELAAVATPIDSLYFITIQSDQVGELRFEMDGEILMPVCGTIHYVADSHHGSLKAPVVLKLLLLSILLLSVAGCKKDVNEPQTIHGNQPRPSWVVTDESNLLSSMTAIIKVTTLNGQAIDDTMVGADDLLAAFIGENCVGIAEYKDGLFYLYLSAEEGTVTLRYYSAYYTNLFEVKDAFVYRNNASIGTVSEPYCPQWVVM